MTIDKHSGLSVLSAPVACIDRRSLSQAWYSALFGADTARVPTNITQVSAKAEPPASPPASVPPKARTAARGAASASKAAVASTRFGILGEAERRAPRTALSRRIERTLRSSSRAPSKAAFTLEGSGERVQLLIRGNGANLKLVALCTPKIKTQVAAALSQARYALALRGIAAETSARDVNAC